MFIRKILLFFLPIQFMSWIHSFLFIPLSTKVFYELPTSFVRENTLFHCHEINIYITVDRFLSGFLTQSHKSNFCVKYISISPLNCHIPLHVYCLFRD